jgi:lysophospholipase L1-like esterase
MKASAFILLSALGAFASASGVPNPEIPAPALDKQWLWKHHSLVNLVAKTSRKPPLDVFFLGDSITEFWPTVAKGVWEAEFSKFQVLNCGVSGDTTQNIQYRILHGEFDRISPRVVVLLAGTNDLARWPELTPEAVSRGIAQILRVLHQRSPRSKIVLVSILPSSEPQSPLRERIVKTNNLISLLADEQSIFYLDIYGSFLDASGQFLPGTTFDLTHPSAKGYQIWADALRPVIGKLIGDSAQ